MGGVATVFLDRDGILNHPVMRGGNPFPPPDLAAVKLYSGVKERLSEIQRSGFKLALVTNQPDVARGKTSAGEVEKINKFIKEIYRLDLVETCVHDDSDRCLCRKPKPGLLNIAGKKLNSDFAQSYMVGDRWKDVEAGRLAGCRTIFVNRNYSEKNRSEPDFEVNSTVEALELILKTIWN